ncbi:MAG: helix-turn-helix domain-containing protein [Planctomycetaceae bacterium]
MAKSKQKKAKLSDQVRDAVDSCGESRYAIAKATGISNSTLSRFMSGERGLTTTALDILSEYLELNIVINRKVKK